MAVAVGQGSSRGSGQVHSSCQQNEARFRLAGAGAVVVSQSSQF